MTPGPRADGAVAGLLLAAGGGARFGGPKALAVLDGEPLVARATRRLAAARLDPRVVVLGACADDVRERADLHGCEVVVNTRWADGMAGSVDRGLASVTGRASAVVITLVDQPLVGVDAIERLVAAWREGALVAVATYAEEHRNPVLLDASVWPAVRERLDGDAGARVFLDEHPELVTRVACDGTGRPDDVDTPDDLRRIERLSRPDRP